MKEQQPVVISIDAIRKKLGHYTGEQKPRFWLDTKSPELNSVLGSEEKGVPYGKIIEVSGNESNGKTALLLELARKAQRDGAWIIWMDLENSFDPEWATQRHLDVSRMTVIESYVIEKEKKKQKVGDVPHLATVEELSKQVEMAIELASRHYEKIFLAVDSVTAMLTEKEAEAGVDGQNMNTKTDLSRFLSQLMRRWVAIATTKNVMMVFINQLRAKPGVMFGDPETTTGGKALPFYSSIRIRMRRSMGAKSKMTKGMDVIGIKGTITNFKNKAGGGSVEGRKIGFKLFFNKSMKFMDAKEVKREED